MPPPAPLIHTHAAILSIGDELTRGQVLDTNSRLISQMLMDAGVEPVEHVTIGDSRAQTADAIRRLAQLTSLVIISGGLGPTLDDLTRDALADVLGEPLVEDPDALRELKALFARRGRELNAMQRLQALRPASARCIGNPFGTAPGLRARVGGADVFCLPGPPGELQPMFVSAVLPAIHPEAGVLVRTKTLHVIGLGEGEAASRVGDLMRRDRNPLVGITASGLLLTWRIRYRGRAGGEQAAAEVESTAEVIRAAMGECVFAEDVPAATAEFALPASVLARLDSRGGTLATVESCTGGMLGAMLTGVPGSSRVYLGGLVTYANQVKESLAGVRPETLVTHGAVSSNTAAQMALGGLEAIGSSHALSITGIAGPDGGTPDKPVGTVHIGLAIRCGDGQPEVRTRRFQFPGSREEVRHRAARSALGMLHFALCEAAPSARRMLFEQPLSGHA